MKVPKKVKETLESIKRVDEENIEWWASRELATALTYADYRNFLEVMRKAWYACKNSGINPNDHFVMITEMVSIGSGAEKQIDTVLMSRYACYLTVQNADSTKKIVGQAQTYFAIQTRRAEQLLDTPFTEEEEKRLMLRGEMKKHNQRLASAAKDAGVRTNKDYGIFQNSGYKGLYGGLDREDIHERKGLTKNQVYLPQPVLNGWKVGRRDFLTNNQQKMKSTKKINKLYIIMKLRNIAFCVLGSICLSGTAATVSSPDGRLVLTTSLSAEGQPLYSVTYDGLPILLDSPLGFVSNIGDFSKGLTLTGEKTGKVDKSFDQAKIKKSHIDWHANTLTESYSAGKKRDMSIEWQVGDNDIAFRYVIPVEGDTRSMIIEKEASGFRFPDFTTTFLTPQSDAMVGWKRTKPSYEENYKADAPLSEKSEFGHGFTFPALFHVGDNGWALLTETGVDGYFCGSRLGDYKDGVFAIEYPMPEENNGNGSANPAISLPGKTPWRTITIGKTLKPIVETTIPWNLVEPLYASDFEVKPGKGTWSWILWQDNSINYDDQIKYIDFAADMGYQNVLVDNWWDTNIGKEGIEKLAKYAQSKGVNLLIWYSSSGWWNDIEQGPINKMSRPIPRKEEMKWLESLGIKGIKVDFFGGDKQETIRLYEDILSDANDHGISVIFHGCTIPRGWERMYPNYVGSEAVLASENLIFSQDFCDMEDFNATLHPFIRNAAGIMEYGGSVLNKRMNRGNDGGNERRTTDAFQLATSILFQNPVQNFALAPNNLTDAPADAIAFMKAVPTTWDDTVFIDGYPGKYVVLARKSTDGKWYIAGVSAEEKPLKLTLDLPMLSKGQEVTLYSEDGRNPLTAKALKIKNPEKVQLTLTKRDGFVIVAD